MKSIKTRRHISFAVYRTRFLKEEENMLPSAGLYQNVFRNISLSWGFFDWFAWIPGVWGNCIKSLATTGVHDYHEHVREMLFVFGRAHGRRKGSRGALSPIDFEIWYFPIHLFVEKCFPAIFKLIKWNFTIVGRSGKYPSEAHGWAKN